MSNQSISIKVNIDNIIKLIEILRETPKYMKALSKKLNAWEEPLAEGKRSFKETLMHLIHSDMSSTNKIYYCMMRDNPTVENTHPENDWAPVLMLDKLSVKELLRYFTLKRKILMELLHSLDMKTWVRKFKVEGNKKSLNVYKEARAMALHEEEHLSTLKLQIKKFISK